MVVKYNFGSVNKESSVSTWMVAQPQMFNVSNF